ncbi:hypothetical protein K435DRAFT_305856, partial [Dendrothele bispora CBS 962.96]
GVSNFSYVSQISGLTYASTASKASKHSHRSKSSRLSLVSEGEKSPHDEEAQSPGTPTEPPFSGNFNDLMPIDTNLVFTQGKSNTDTIRPKRKKGPKGPRRPISPMTFVPMGKSPTSAHVNKGGFAPYETYATYSPEEPTPGMSIARGIGEMEQTEMQSIDSGSTVPATGVKALRDGPGKAYKRFFGEASSEDEGTVFHMGYEDEDEEDDEYDEEDEEGQDRDKDNEEQEDEHVDDNAPPPGTGRIGPPPPMLAPNRPDMSTISSSTTTIVPGSSGSHTHTGTSQSQSNITTLGTLFSSKAAKDKDKSKRDKKEKEKSKSKSKEQKKKEKEKEKEKPHRSKLEKADRGGDRTKDWVEYERSKEREREMFTSSISAMSGLTNKTRTRTRDRDLRDGKD